MLSTIQKQIDYQDSDEHKALLVRVNLECREHIINKKEILGPTKYMDFTPLGSVAWRRDKKRPGFSAKA